MAESEHIPIRRFGKIRTHTYRPDILRETIRRALQRGTPLFVTYANAHNVCVAEEGADYRSALASFDIVFPEGVGLKFAARKLGYTEYAAFHTTDFWPTLFPAIQEEQAGVFLLGATKDTLNKAAVRLTKLGLTITGTADGFDDADDAATAVSAISNAGARVLFLGMGVPRQEIWAAAQRETLPAMVVICVGNYFEFLSGNVTRAPKFMRRIGLEWLHRLLVEPGRLWRRYILGIPRFWKIIRRQQRGAT